MREPITIKYAIEAALPWVTLGLCVVGAHYWIKHLPLPDNPDQILVMSVTVSSILVGFLAVAKTNLISMKATGVGKNLCASGSFGKVMRFFMHSIKCLLVCTAVSAAGLLLHRHPAWMCFVFCYLWVAVLGYTAGSCWRSLSIYEKFMDEATK